MLISFITFIKRLECDKIKRNMNRQEFNNMNVYDQLTQLQILEHAFVEWKDYRKALTYYIMSQFPTKSQLAIWGAGRCNDLDLKILSEHFGVICLLDKDESAMKEALKQYGLAESNKVQIKVCDFTFIGAEAYRTYADILVKEVRKEGLKTNIHQLADKALCYLDNVEMDFDKSQLDLGTKSYEYAVMIGIHSQLISMFDWIWQVILQTLGQEDESVRQKIIQLNEKVVRKFNCAFWQATKYKAIVGCELNKSNQVGSIQGAIQAIEQIEKEILKGTVKREQTTYFEWPFNKSQGVSYKMQLQVLQMNQ